ncbi:MAG TPA: hypothetical protein VF980_06960 [Thermoanaerobaculia bacterium]
MNALHYVPWAGVPSITSVALLSDLVASHRWFERTDRRAMLATLAILCIIIYAAVLGFLPDIYRLGFTPLPTVLLALTGIVLARRSTPLAVFALVVLLAFDLHLLPSMNLFDYIVDPIGGTFAIGWCAWRAAQAVFARPATVSRRAAATP